MQFSALVIAAVSAASMVLASPASVRDAAAAGAMEPRDTSSTDATDSGIDVAACETNVAAQQTACLATCSSAPCFAYWYVFPFSLGR